MNSGGASAGGLCGALVTFTRDDSREERAAEEAAALWVALAQQVTNAQALPSAGTEPTSAWRPSAGDMTPAFGPGVATGGAPVDAKAEERMVLRVDGGALGELEVTLDRQGSSLSIVIGMENQRLVGSVLPDAQALRSALQSVGIDLRALNIVPASEVGTVLAQRRVSQSGTKPSASPGAAQDPETLRERTHKRLTLIG